MRVEVHAEVPDELIDRWEALHRADPLSSPFTSPGWVQATWRHYGDGARPWVLAVSDEDRLVALAPLAIRRQGGVQIAGPLAESLSDYWDVIASPEARAPALAALGRELRRRAGRDWDELRVTHLPGASATAVEFGRSGTPRAADSGYPCPGVELPVTWDEYLRSLPGRRRSNLVRHLRRLEDGTVVLRPVQNPNEISAAVTRWHELRIAQWREQGRALHPLQGTDRYRCFVTDALADLIPGGRALLWEMTVDGELAGSYLNFVDAGTYYWYLGGYVPQHSALGLGKIAIGEGIRMSIAAGRARYDFMIGAEPYKYWYGARDDRGVQGVTVRSRSLRSLAAFSWRRARERRRR
jgi:CelD/BcsL family acetyltransferase involved in cellulose biosynthesis